MGQTLNHDGSITVIAYSLPEFAFKICELAAKGFTVTFENNKAVSGGFGSYYTGTLVPRHQFYIGFDGTRYNEPKTSTETSVKAPTSVVSDDKAATVATESKEAVTSVKQAPTEAKTARSTAKKTT